MTTKAKVLRALIIFAVLYVVLTAVLLITVGSLGRREDFLPHEEFRLDAWIPISLGGLDLSINRAVLYLALASALTIGTLTFIASRMRRAPNRVQMAVELAYDMVRNTITRGNIPDDQLARRWFPYIATLFFFLWFSNMIGLVPLPFNTAHTTTLFGLEVPTFGLYAATANVSVPVVFALVSTSAYHIEGIRKRGALNYFRSWLPGGLETMNPIGKGAIFMIEVISHAVRPISLSVRLFANILAGHLLILFMAGGLAVLLGIAALAVITFPLAFAFFVFEIVIIATLQAFIFSILTAIYLGEAVAEGH